MLTYLFKGIYYTPINNYCIQKTVQIKRFPKCRTSSCLFGEGSAGYVSREKRLKKKDLESS